MFTNIRYLARYLFSPCLLLLFFTFVFVVNSFIPFNELAGAKEYGSTLSRCEYKALRFGSEIADEFNAPHFEYDTKQRFLQENILKMLGFYNWPEGRTITDLSVENVVKSGLWNSSNSLYHKLQDKWIYMFGDSTTRQIWAAFDMDPDFISKAQEYSRTNCRKQSARHHSHSGPNDIFDEEGWRGRCAVNEMTCFIKGHGEKGVLTLDWKHFPYEDYDEELFSDHGPWLTGFSDMGKRRPDLFTIQFGLHSCFHANTESIYSKYLTAKNSTMIAEHQRDIWKLIQKVRQIIDTPIQGQLETSPTTVIFLTSGSIGTGMMEFIETDACIQQFNTILKKAANTYGFAVLERGEIERRFMRNSLYTTDPIFHPNLHLARPVPEMIASSLTYLYACLEEYGLSVSNFSNAGKDLSLLYPLPREKQYRNWEG